jgi:hypothetical protein
VHNIDHDEFSMIFIFAAYVLLSVRKIYTVNMMLQNCHSLAKELAKTAKVAIFAKELSKIAILSQTTSEICHFGENNWRNSPFGQKDWRKLPFWQKKW